ncbi:glutaredoxin 3 [Microbulbifer magnicolonia]|uniref:glutaredoxin 3 n=1 Tax=Microbulbifer magnicolonia TaxID=3109744 RepID=UPI002B4066A5|nr:glutaredoxin 3 [Microbulbifer sp. GG15]
MQDVVIYTTRFCPYCIRAKDLLNSKGVKYREIAVDNDPALREQMARKAGRRTVPQIWIGEHHVGGCDELMALERSRQLDGLLRAG